MLPCELLLTLQILVTCILTVWSLPLSIRTIIGPRINKQGPWLGATPTTGNEKQGEIWRDLSHKLWTGHLLCKATPRAYRPKPRHPEQDVRGPCMETEVPSRCSGQRNKLKSEEEEVPEANKWKERQVTQCQTLVCFRGQALYQHPLYALKELWGNQESESLSSHYQAHRTTKNRDFGSEPQVYTSSRARNFPQHYVAWTEFLHLEGSKGRNNTEVNRR